ncbi:F-actin capping protein beta subunit [Cutaneotrichosporon oleaginosum]|uniref:F-actin-capping protein subunit beta n=1 Tax=Cutaneotrichosporon oleaginosum TaxID=879819 RepID=A0A0J1AWG4_9TREE|nr:F-actin capping protein beta subunit [Cutaneotrichosporon oleaginosum]KLT39639.1 F-actin capping protein beta subunit [Cutaneotrichosporon oleaginosum]
MADENTLGSLLDLLRRLPPTRVEANVEALANLAPEFADDLYANTDQPLRVLHDEEAGRSFLGCDYNRDGDSFRSPWTDKYLPPAPGAPQPSPRLRQLEVLLNAAFDTYREMYYEGGVSSVYLWDLGEDMGTKDLEFAGVVLMKKDLPADTGLTGNWDSLHVFECTERGRTAKYKLTSTVMLVLEAPTSATLTDKAGAKVAGATADGKVTLSGSMTRQAEVDYPLTGATSHVNNVGRMVEDMEIKMRNLLSAVYFGKTQDVVGELRSQIGLEARSREDQLRAELAGAIGARR